MASFILFALARVHSLLTLQSALVAVITALSVWLYWMSNGKKTPLLPGPFRIPYFGSISVLAQFLSNKSRHQLRVDLAKKFGKIYAIHVGKFQMVFLNELELIKEAFVTKGEIISDRLPVDPSNKLTTRFGQGKGIGGAKYDRDFKERKTLTLHSMKDFGFGGKTLEDTALEETSYLVDEFKRVADTGLPTDIHQRLVHLAVSNVICSVVFGRRFAYDDAEFVKAVDGIRSLFTQRSTFLQRIPLIHHLPFAKKRLEDEARQGLNVLEFVEGQIEKHREEFDPNCPKDFIDLCLQKAELEGAEGKKSRIGTENIKKIILDLFFAGTDTTAASLSWFLLFMIHFPDIQRKCQEEIDAVLDVDGVLTNVSSNKSFPFTTATLLETQRISSIAGSSLPHVVREDTTVGGYHVKKGSIVFANIRFLHMDERYWSSPETFDPSRWIDPDDSSKIIQHSHFAPFSIGKRRCLGENLAKAEYSVFAITLLRNFTFKMADPTKPPTREGFGMVFSPRPFDVVIESRQRSA